MKLALRNLFLLIGFDPRKIWAFRHYLKFRGQLKKFKKMGGTVDHIQPIFSDYDEQAGSAKGHYFHQDLLVASLVYENKPVRHIDIGSRIDGFVAHVASYRQIDVMDVRSLKHTGHNNICFIQADLMNEANAESAITDSISCLHAIEHFGLGRYGDPIDPRGHIKGFANLYRMLKPGGRLYISFPIAQTGGTHFNVHRVFHPKDIFNWGGNMKHLRLERFDYIDDHGNLHMKTELNSVDENTSYGCGIYTFTKTDK